MTHPYRLLLMAPAFFLGACATTTPLTPFPSSHPASPEAQEAPRRPFQNPLASDEATKKSDELLMAADNGTLTPAPAEPMDMSPMPGMDMSGMKMNGTPAPPSGPATKMSPTPSPTLDKDSNAMPGMKM